MSKKFSFLHLVGLGGPSQSAENDPEKKDPEDGTETGDENAGADNATEEQAGDDKEKAAAKPADNAAKPDALRQAVLAERERCAEIFGSPEAAGRVAMAASLAFETDLPAAQAISLLKSAPKQGGSLAARMAAAPDPKLGAGGASGADLAEEDRLANSILAAGAKLKGGK